MPKKTKISTPHAWTPAEMGRKGGKAGTEAQMEARRRSIVANGLAARKGTHCTYCRKPWDLHIPCR